MPETQGLRDMDGCGTEGCGPTLAQSGTEPGDTLGPLEQALPWPPGEGHPAGRPRPAGWRTRTHTSRLSCALSSSHTKRGWHTVGGGHPPGSCRG